MIYTVYINKKQGENLTQDVIFLERCHLPYRQQGRETPLDNDLLLQLRKSRRVLHHELLEQLGALALARVVMTVIVAVDANLRAALLAHRRRRLEELFWVLDVLSPGLRVVDLQAVEWLPGTNQLARNRVGPHVVRPQDEVIELHWLARLASAVILDPLHVHLLTAQVLRSLKRVPAVDVSVARWVLAVAARRISADALVHSPQVILNPHAVVLLEDDGGGVWEDRNGPSL